MYEFYRHSPQYVREWLVLPGKLDVMKQTGKGEEAREIRKSPSQDLPHESTPSMDSSIYFKDGERKVDFVIVYQHRQGDKESRLIRQDFENQLLGEGMELEYDGPDPEDPDSLACVKLHAPWELLCRCAEMLQMRMPVRRNDTEEDKELCTIPLFAFSPADKALLPDCPSYVTAPFDLGRMDQFLIEDFYHPDSFFTPIQRIRIVWDLLQRTPVRDIGSIQSLPGSANAGDAKSSKSFGNSSAGRNRRGIQWLLSDKIYLAAFPLHDGEDEPPKVSTEDIANGATVPRSKWGERQVLRHMWSNFGRIFSPQPLDAIRRYFGEHVAFYFAWLGFYTQMLVFPSVAGVVCFATSLVLAGRSDIVKETCEEDAAPGNLTMCPVCSPEICDAWSLADSCTPTWWAAVFDNASTVLMAIFTVFWASIFQELWKRREAELSFRWDSTEPEKSEEEIRPEFEARTQYFQINPVTKEEEPYVPLSRKLLLVGGSISALLFLIMCVVTALVGLVVVRIALYGVLKALGGVFEQQKMDFASWAVNGLTFAVVMALGWFYSRAAHRLTEMECPRTQQDYLSSYIWKVFIFEILNNFIPVLYVAFMKGRSLALPSQQNYFLEMCDPSGCLNEVVGTVAILLLFRLVVSNAAELGIPMLQRLLKRRKAVDPVAEEKALHGRWRDDFGLNEPDLDGVYAEYLEMMVQFGFVTLFVPAFPLIPLICLLNNVVEIRLDATNFVSSFRRPLPVRVSGIKVWYQCLNILTKLAVLCNAGLIAFTSDLIPLWVYQWYESKDGSTRGYAQFRLSVFQSADWGTTKSIVLLEQNVTHCYYPGYNDSNPPYDATLIWWKIMTFRLLFFLAFTIVFYYFQWLCDFLIPDTPEAIQIKSDRAQYLAKKALYLSDRSRAESRIQAARSRRDSRVESLSLHTLPHSTITPHTAR